MNKNDSQNSADSQHAANRLKEFFKRWPKFYYFIFDFFGPVYFGGLGPIQFLKKYPSEGKCLNLGSGPRRLVANVINVDITKYDGVDIQADITSLPFPADSISRIICDQTLEHVPNFVDAVSEMKRILRSGGFAYVSTPFLYPFHASPSDFQRWTHNGLKELFKDFEIVELAVRCGPFSTLCTYCCYLFASVFSFGNESLYWFLVLASLIFLFPIKFLDVIGNRLPFSINMACVLYTVIKKK